MPRVYDSVLLPQGTKLQSTAGALSPRAAEAQKGVPPDVSTGQYQEDATNVQAAGPLEGLQVPDGDGRGVASSQRSDKAMAFEAFRQASPLVANYEKNRGLLRDSILEAKAVAQQVLP